VVIVICGDLYVFIGDFCFYSGPGYHSFAVYSSGTTNHFIQFNGQWSEKTTWCGSGLLYFTFFTLFLSALVKATGLSGDSLRLISVVVVFAFGLSLVLPQAQLFIEKLFTKLSGITPKAGKQTGFVGGLLIGLSLGLLWTPCVGPILASVIALAASGTVSSTAVVITFAYATGTAVPMLEFFMAANNYYTEYLVT